MEVKIPTDLPMVDPKELTQVSRRGRGAGKGRGATGAARAGGPNAALTVREVQEDVHRIVESGLFRSCMPVAVDTRDGIRLVFEVLLLSSNLLLSPLSFLISGANEGTISVLLLVSGGAEPRLPWAGM